MWYRGNGVWLSYFHWIFLDIIRRRLMWRSGQRRLWVLTDVHRLHIVAYIQAANDDYCPHSCRRKQLAARSPAPPGGTASQSRVRRGWLDHDPALGHGRDHGCGSPGLKPYLVWHRGIVRARPRCHLSQRSCYHASNCCARGARRRDPGPPSLTIAYAFHLHVTGQTSA